MLAVLINICCFSRESLHMALPERLEWIAAIAVFAAGMECQNVRHVSEVHDVSIKIDPY